MKRFLIVEDHPVMSAGTCQMIRQYMPDSEFTEVDTFWKAMYVAKSGQFDLIILDIGIPGGDSVQMVEKLRQLCPCSRLLIFSGYDECVYALPFIKAGANGFLSKKASEAEFRLAVETVLLKNKTYLGEAVRDLTLSSYIKSKDHLENELETLSMREKEVLGLFYERKGVSEIGALLNLSASTVNTHRIRIFKKFQVKNMNELIHKYQILKHA